MQWSLYLYDYTTFLTICHLLYQLFNSFNLYNSKRKMKGKMHLKGKAKKITKYAFFFHSYTV